MFKKIPYFDSYCIDEYGEVVSLLSNKTLKPCAAGKGYLTVCLRKNKKTYRQYLHHLVASTFLPLKSESSWIINHKDGNKTNNHVDNLEWTTYSANNQHAYDNELKERGESFYSAKLSEDNVKEILIKGKYTTYQEIADKYGVAKATIRDILIRRTWKHIQIENSNDYSEMEVAWT